MAPVLEDFLAPDPEPAVLEEAELLEVVEGFTPPVVV